MLFSNILLILFVTLWYTSMLYVPQYFGLLDDIKKNWPKYRCSPMVLPIAGYLNKQDDQTEGEATSENFTYCTQNILTNFMGSLLEPISYLLSGLSGFAIDLNINIDFIRGIIDNIRTFVSTITDGIYGMVVNIIVQFIKIFVQLRDIITRMMGTLMTVYYIIIGSVKTVTSGGKAVETFLKKPTDALFCFHPNTTLKKKNGQLCKIADISLGEVLDGNSEVIIILKIKNNKNNQLYKLINTNDNSDIIVSGSHLIKTTNGYIEVKNHPKAIKTDIYNEELYCLITNNQKIKIGKYYFHDWEDDVERDKLYFTSKNKII